MKLRWDEHTRAEQVLALAVSGHIGHANDERAHQALLDAWRIVRAEQLTGRTIDSRAA
jgi:hypothetical protein